MTPLRRTYATAWVRLRAPSLRRMWRMWVFTVPSATTNLAAISRSVLPLASSIRTSISPAVRPSDSRRAPPPPGHVLTHQPCARHRSAGQPHRVVCGRDFADDIHILDAGQEGPDPVPDEHQVICEQNANRLHRSLPKRRAECHEAPSGLTLHEIGRTVRVLQRTSGLCWRVLEGIGCGGRRSLHLPHVGATPL